MPSERRSDRYGTNHRHENYRPVFLHLPQPYGTGRLEPCQLHQHQQRGLRFAQLVIRISGAVDAKGVGNLPLGNGFVSPQIAELLCEKNHRLLFQIHRVELVQHTSGLLPVQQNLQDGMIGLHIPVEQRIEEFLGILLDI